MICGSAFKNKGVQPLLDAVVDFLPSPLEVPPTEGLMPGTDEMVVREPSDTAPMSGLAFKIMNDPFVGSLTFVRIYSGKIESGSYLQNTVKDQRERIGRILLMHANNREEIKEAFAGDIVALVGLKNTTTGDTLCDAGQAGHPRADGVPGSGDRGRGRAASKADQEKMGVALSRLAAEDPVVPRRQRPESGQTVIKGMGELHLEIIVDRMKREFKVEANVGAPQVAYRETITKRAEVDYTHKKQTRRLGPVRAGEAESSRPARRAAGSSSTPRWSAARCRRNTSRAWRRASTRPSQTGVIAGFPMVDLVVQLVDGAYHEVDSSALAFEIASRAAFKEGIARRGRSCWSR